MASKTTAKRAAGKPMTFDEKVGALHERFAREFNDLDEVTSDMLRSYCVVCVQVEDLNEIVRREGYLVEDSKGVPREHPCINTAHKLTADKARYFTALKRILNKQDEEGEAEDFDAFLGL